MRTNKLILVRGLPGSGKTTFAEFLVESHSGNNATLLFAADDYFYENGNYKFDINKLHAAHMYCQKRVEDVMERITNSEVELLKRYAIVVHNTFTTEKEMKPYIQLAEKYGFEVTSLIVENRHGNKSIHNVPEETMQRMKDRFSVKI